MRRFSAIPSVNALTKIFALYDSSKKISPRTVEAAEAERVQRRDRTRTHGKDIAQNAADAGRGALIRLDERRMVVALHLEDRREAVADIDDAGILAGPLDNGFSCRRQSLQMRPRAFVAAVLGPHDGEDAELRIIRLAFEKLDDLAVFFFAEAVGGHDLSRDRGLGRHFQRAHPAHAFFSGLPTAKIIEEKILSPSSLPRIFSVASSGCGIRPKTFLASLQTPAMLSSEPFGLAAAVAFPLASTYRSSTWRFSLRRSSVAASAK